MYVCLVRRTGWLWQSDRMKGPHRKDSPLSFILIPNDLRKFFCIAEITSERETDIAYFFLYILSSAVIILNLSQSVHSLLALVRKKKHQQALCIHFRNKNFLYYLVVRRNKRQRKYALKIKNEWIHNWAYIIRYWLSNYMSEH